MTPAERIKMMISNKLNNAHEKEKVKRIIREEEVEEAKKERQREWRYQLQKQKERGAIDIDIDRFTNEQMERMIFDKSYNPLKNETKAITGGEGGANPDEDGSGPPAGGYASEEDPEEEARKKAILRARFAAKS